MLLISFVVKIRDGGSFYIFDFDDEEEQNISESYQPPRSNDNSSNTKEMEEANDRVDNSSNSNKEKNKEKKETEAITDENRQDYMKILEYDAFIDKTRKELEEIEKSMEFGEAISESIEIQKRNQERNERNNERRKRNQERINENDNSPLEKLEEMEIVPKLEMFSNSEEAYSISLPKSGYSPYDSYFGKGVYNNSADNYIKVTAPISYHIVFLLKDVYSKRTIRNEFIRKGSTFDLTGIPYGTYEFSYFSGDDWSDQQEMKNGEIKGGFTMNKSFSKSQQYKDRMEFKSDQYGGYEIQLISTVSGNLSTQTSNEDEFFN